MSKQNPDDIRTRNTFPSLLKRGEKRSPTIKMCRFVHLESPPCSGDYSWRLESKGRIFVVCDAHLAEGIKMSGLPALVSSFKTMQHEDHKVQCCVFEESFNQNIKTSPGLYIKKNINDDNID